jgi:hypothetical protein
MKIDIDDNSFSGFDNIRKSIAKDDPARIGYSEDLTVLVRSQIYYLLNKWADKSLL